MILYIYSKCSTCQKAVQFLKGKGLSVVLKEIVIEPPSVRELEKMLTFQNGQLKKLFNTSGQLYREMGLTDRLGQMSTSDAFLLLSQNGMLVKRPFLLAEGWGLLGFREEEWSQRL
jgi:arsenate reductase (glutaredoxin)